MGTEKDLRQYWRALLARKHFFIWPALAVMVIAGIVALVLTPVYESKSTILIESQQIPPEFVKSTVTGHADQRIQSLNQLGLGAGVGMVALTESLDHSVKNTDELAWLNGLPVLGQIAHIVTPEDMDRKKHRLHLIRALLGLSVFIGLILRHFFVMDLWILAARGSRFLGKHL